MRELVVLGTASQAPTRHRNHNGYLLRWDGDGILFDPGEGTQRQLLVAGVSPWTFGRICITHLHGDHCLGLPGVVQRLSLDRVTHPVEVLYPSSGQVYIDRLLHASVFDEHVDVRQRPVVGSGVVEPGPPYALMAAMATGRMAMAATMSNSAATPALSDLPWANSSVLVSSKSTVGASESKK